jgi:hypothetical protein
VGHDGKHRRIAAEINYISSLTLLLCTIRDRIDLHLGLLCRKRRREKNRLTILYVKKLGFKENRYKQMKESVKKTKKKKKKKYVHMYKKKMQETTCVPSVGSNLI